jgi:DNA-binding CsgD family transcriptional regulator
LATVHQRNVMENISLYHSWSAEPPGPESMAFVRLLAPHLQNALRTRVLISELRVQVQDLAAAMHALWTPVFLFDRTGRCAFTNVAARALLSSQRGISYQDGRLVIDNHERSQTLAALIRRAIALNTLGRSKISKSLGGGAMLIPRGESRPLRLHVAPLPPTHIPGGGNFAAIGFISDPDDTPSLPEDMLRELYGLTQSEARLASQIAAGVSLSDAANCIGVSRETVRTQLKSIFQKTGTRKQSDLIRLIGMKA